MYVVYLYVYFLFCLQSCILWSIVNAFRSRQPDEFDFLLTSSTSPRSYKWIVPLSYVTEDQPHIPKKVVLNMTSGMFISAFSAASIRLT